MRKFIANDFGNYNNWRRTFGLITYSTYSILNDFVNWNNVPEFDRSGASQLLKQIAFINLKKIPGASRSYDPVIAAAFQQHRQLILDQIEIINPEIIIGGHTLHHMYYALGIPGAQVNKDGCYFTDKRVYIEVDHPNQTQISHEKYFENVVNPIKYWAENIRK